MNYPSPILKSLLLFALLSAVPITAHAQSGEEADAVLLPQDALEWTEVVPGISFAPAYGDWQTERHGKFIRFDPGVEVPMHTHSNGYYGVVLEGRLTNPYAGEDDAPEMGPGTHWYVPGEVEHSNTCVSEEPCLLYTHADAAWDITVVEE